MEEFEPTINQINDDIKPAWEDIKYLSEKFSYKTRSSTLFY